MLSATLLVTLAAIAAANLVLTLGVTRRVNQLARLAVAGPATTATQPASSRLPQAGIRPADFTAVTYDGDRLSRAELAERTLAGFFATGCAPCKQLIPAFMSYASAMPGGREQVLAVIATSAHGEVEAAKLAGLLNKVAKVIVEPAEGPVSAAFGVALFPAVCMLDAGRISASGYDLSRFPPAPAPTMTGTALSS